VKFDSSMYSWLKKRIPLMSTHAIFLVIRLFTKYVLIQDQLVYRVIWYSLEYIEGHIRKCH